MSIKSNGAYALLSLYTFFCVTAWTYAHWRKIRTFINCFNLDRRMNKWRLLELFCQQSISAIKKGVISFEVSLHIHPKIVKDGLSPQNIRGWKSISLLWNEKCQESYLICSPINWKMSIFTRSIMDNSGEIASTVSESRPGKSSGGALNRNVWLATGEAAVASHENLERERKMKMRCGASKHRRFHRCSRSIRFLVPCGEHMDHFWKLYSTLR